MVGFLAPTADTRYPTSMDKLPYHRDHRWDSLLRHYQLIDGPEVAPVRRFVGFLPDREETTNLFGGEYRQSPARTIR